MNYTDVQTDLHLFCLHMAQDRFSQDVTHLIMFNTVTITAKIEPRHEKTNKMHVRPVKTQIWSDQGLRNGLNG